jgi:hypothetical protein
MTSGKAYISFSEVMDVEFVELSRERMEFVRKRSAR